MIQILHHRRWRLEEVMKPGAAARRTKYSKHAGEEGGSLAPAPDCWAVAINCGKKAR